jgi:hypothetical protein
MVVNLTTTAPVRESEREREGEREDWVSGVALVAPYSCVVVFDLVESPGSVLPGGNIRGAVAVVSVGGCRHWRRRPEERNREVRGARGCTEEACPDQPYIPGGVGGQASPSLPLRQRRPGPPRHAQAPGGGVGARERPQRGEGEAKER